MVTRARITPEPYLNYKRRGLYGRRSIRTLIACFLGEIIFHELRPISLNGNVQTPRLGDSSLEVLVSELSSQKSITLGHLRSETLGIVKVGA